MIELDCTSLFDVPLLTWKDDDCVELNARLIDEIKNIKEPSSDRCLSGEWRSKHDFFQRNGTCIALRDKIIEVSKAAVTRLGLINQSARVEFDGWINVNPPGAFNAPHDHAQWKLSGTYYVATPKDCGAIELLAPTSCRPTRARRAIEPKAGMFLLFPSSVYHWVHPNKSSSNRVSIAWNMRW